MSSTLADVIVSGGAEVAVAVQIVLSLLQPCLCGARHLKSPNTALSPAAEIARHQHR